MADNSRAKSHLDQVETKLNRIDDIDSINAVVAARSLDLFRNLTSKNLFVDEDVKSSLATIKNQLDTQLVSDANSRIWYLTTELAWLPANPWNATRRAAIAREISNLHRIVDTTWNRMPWITNRYDEYSRLLTFANYFNLSWNLTDLNINTSTTPVSWTTVVNLSNFVNTWAPTPNYELCDEQWNKLPQTWWNYKINIWWQEYTLWWIPPLWWNLDCSAMTISPALLNSPLEVALSINAVYKDTPTGTNVQWVNVVCNKKFKLKLNDGNIPLNDIARGVQFDNYNNTLPVWHKIWDTVETNFATNRYKIERKVLEKILKKNGWTKFDTLNPKQKEDFYQRIRNQVLWWWVPYFDNIYNVENINIPADRYEAYKNRFIADWKDRNKWDNIKKNANYIALIHNTVTDKIDDFFWSKLENFMWKLPEETRLKSELTRFLDEIEKNKLDDDLNTRVNTDVSRKNHKMDKWPRSLLHNRDTNYMRFFSNSSTSVRWQKVDIKTNTDPNSIDNLEPVKYDMDVNITWKNNISVEIKIEWTNEVIKHKSGEPSALIRKIMRDQRIKYWKARAHIGFNVYKAMVQMAKEKDISLQYRDNANHTRFIDIENGNIVVRQIDNLTTLSREDSKIIFDQEKFLNSNEFDKVNHNWALRQWLDKIWIHFNLAMNQLHKQYRKWVEKRFGSLISSKSRMTLPTSFWLSPVKKILNLGDISKFDFNTTVQSGWKNINIDFKKNKFTINMEWLKKPLSSRDLWKILNHRQKRMRVFDGMERDIVEWIYSALISKLRENSKINRTDFWVKDDITGNMYVLDQDGEFGMITREDLKSISNPIRWVSWKNFGSLSQLKLSWVTVRKLEEKQVKELMKNPFLMQRLVKAMNQRMWFGESIKAMFRK